MEGVYLTQDEITNRGVKVALATEGRPYLGKLEYRVPMIERLMYLAGMNTLRLTGHEGDTDKLIPTAFGLSGINTAVATTFAISPAETLKVDSEDNPNLAPSLRRIAQWYDTTISFNRSAIGERIERNGLKVRNPHSWAPAVDHYLKRTIWGNLFKNTVGSAMTYEITLTIAELGTAAMFLAEKF